MVERPRALDFTAGDGAVLYVCSPPLPLPTGEPGRQSIEGGYHQETLEYI